MLITQQSLETLWSAKYFTHSQFKTIIALSDLSSSGSPHSHNLCPARINYKSCLKGMGVGTLAQMQFSNSCFTLSLKGELRRQTRGGSQAGRGEPDHEESFLTLWASRRRWSKMGTCRTLRESESTMELLLNVVFLLKMEMWILSYLTLYPQRQVSVEKYELPGWKVVCSSKVLSVFTIMLHLTHHRCKG